MYQQIDVRKLNQWLKANVPFAAKCRKERDGYVISADVANDLHVYKAAIEATFAVKDVRAYGQKCWLTIPFFVSAKAA